MKLSILHETTTVGAVAIMPAALGRVNGGEVYKPRGLHRWYLEFADTPQVSGLMEGDTETNSKSPKQFGDQPSQTKKLVWQPLEKKHSKKFKRWYLGQKTEAKPPRQSSPTFPPPERDYSDFIIGNGK